MPGSCHDFLPGLKRSALLPLCPGPVIVRFRTAETRSATSCAAARGANWRPSPYIGFSAAALTSDTFAVAVITFESSTRVLVILSSIQVFPPNVVNFMSIVHGP